MTKRNEAPWGRQWCLKESFQNEIAFGKVVGELFSNFKSVVSGNSILNFILICIESFIKLTSQNNVLVNAWIEFDGLINAYINYQPLFYYFVIVWRCGVSLHMSE